MTRERGMSYVAIAISLLIAAIIIATAVILYTKGRGEPGIGKGIEAPIPRARGVECLSKVRKFETAVAMFNADSGYYPLRLADVPELEGESLFCPVTRESYRYDRETGKVTCPYHH